MNTLNKFLSQVTRFKSSQIRLFSSAISSSTQASAIPFNRANPISKPESSDDIKQQREMFEDSLKFAASNLSNKTDASTLVQLLRTTAFLDNQELAVKLSEYLKSKISSVSNEELASLYCSLVLLKLVDQKLLKVMEYLTLRRVHSLQPNEISKIFASYAYLCKQKKSMINSSFVKTFEYVVHNRMHEFQMNDLAECLISLFRLQQLTALTKVITNQTLLQIFDKLNFELEDEIKKIKTQTLSELYYHLHMHQSLNQEVDVGVLDERLLKSSDFKAKDIFDIITVTKNAKLLEHLVPQIIKLVPTFIPEEIIILANLIQKHNLKKQLSMSIQEYIDQNLTEMDDYEVSRVYQSCLRNLDLTADFKTKMNKILINKLPKITAQALPYLLPIAKEEKIENKQVREVVMKVLRQKDFSSETYIKILGEVIDQQKDKFKEDLEFWRQIMVYVPMIQLQSIDQYCKLKSCIQYLDQNIKELDFSNLINYLEERYEKPLLAIKEEKVKEIKDK